MQLKINTPRGIFKYKFQVVYEGIKVMNQAIAKENLLLFRHIAEKKGLKFGLAFGTLLGAIREHDFIAHDEDIDLFILKEDIDKFKDMLWDLNDAGFRVMRFDRRDSLCSIIRKGEYIDIYIFKKLCDGVRDFNGESLPEKYLVDLCELEFQGEKFLAAREASDFCLFEYGETWQTPIAMKPYDMGWYQKCKSLLYWQLHYRLPYFLFRRYAMKKALEKIRLFNYQVERYNKNVGKEVYRKLPEEYSF